MNDDNNIGCTINLTAIILILLLFVSTYISANFLKEDKKQILELNNEIYLEKAIGYNRKVMVLQQANKTPIIKWIISDRVEELTLIDIKGER